MAYRNMKDHLVFEVLFWIINQAPCLAELSQALLQVLWSVFLLSSWAIFDVQHTGLRMKWEDCWQHLAPRVCRRTPVQGMRTAVVPLFIFNHTREKNVIMACLPQSPPYLGVFELFELKASGNVAFSGSGVHPRADQECFHVTMVSCWAFSRAEERGHY